MKKHLLLNIVLSAVFLLVSIVSRVFNTNPIFVIVCGIIASIILIGILVLFAIAFMDCLYCLAIFVVAYWGLCIENYFYDGFGGEGTMMSMTFYIIIPLILSVTFTLFMALLRVIKMHKTKQQLKFSDTIIAIVVTTFFLFVTFCNTSNYLNYAFSGGKHLEVSVELDEFIYTQKGKSVGRVDNLYYVHSLDNNVYIDEIAINERYDVNIGDIVTITYYDGLFVKSYKVCYDTLPLKGFFEE